MLSAHWTASRTASKSQLAPAIALGVGAGATGSQASRKLCVAAPPPPSIYGQKYGQFNGPVHGVIKPSRYAPRHWGGVKLKSLWLPSRSVFSPKIHTETPLSMQLGSSYKNNNNNKSWSKKKAETKNHKTRKKLYPSTATTTNTITADPTIIKNTENWVGNRESWWQWKYPVLWLL